MLPAPVLSFLLWYILGHDVASTSAHRHEQKRCIAAIEELKILRWLLVSRPVFAAYDEAIEAIKSME